MQLINFSWLREEQEALAAILIEAIRDHAKTGEILPLLRLEQISIHPIPHASTPYLRFDFACSWDEEHGLGVLTYGTEIVAIGTGEVANDTSVAETHREKMLERLR